MPDEPSDNPSASDGPALPSGISADDRVVLFDGVCVLCNTLAHWVAKRDPRGRLKMTALQSESGQSLLRYAGLPEDDTDTMVFFDRGRVYLRSSAALRVAGFLRFPWWLLGGFRLVPWFLRDPLYRWVARRRYRWFGRHEMCHLPDADLRDRFLPG